MLIFFAVMRRDLAPSVKLATWRAVAPRAEEQDDAAVLRVLDGVESTDPLKSRESAERDGRQAWLDATRRCQGIVEERPAARRTTDASPEDHIIDWCEPYVHAARVGEAVKKVTANIPAKLLERAQEATGLGITETLVAGLEELERSRKRSALRGLRGRVRIDLDLEKTRR